VLVQIDQLARAPAVDEGHNDLVVLHIGAQLSGAGDIEVAQDSSGKGLQQLGMVAAVGPPVALPDGVAGAWQWDDDVADFSPGRKLGESNGWLLGEEAP